MREYAAPDYSELVSLSSRLPRFQKSESVFDNEIVRALFDRSRSNQHLSVKAFSIVIGNISENIEHFSFWKFVSDWIAESRFAEDDLYSLRPLIEVTWNSAGTRVRYIEESILWRLSSGVMFFSDPLSISRRLDLARTFFYIGRYDASETALEMLYEDLSELDDGSYLPAWEILINHGFFFLELANLTDNGVLSELGREFQKLVEQ